MRLISLWVCKNFYIIGIRLERHPEHKVLCCSCKDILKASCETAEKWIQLLIFILTPSLCFKLTKSFLAYMIGSFVYHVIHIAQQHCFRLVFERLINLFLQVMRIL